MFAIRAHNLSRLVAVVACAASASLAAAQTAQYTITELNVPQGYDYLLINLNGARIINNAGQVIAQAVKVHHPGDLPNLIAPDVDYVAVRYTPGIGVEHIAVPLTQNTILPWQINEVGTVQGKAVQNELTFNDLGRMIGSDSQHELWRVAPNGAFEILNVPQEVKVRSTQSGNRYRLNNAGVPLILTVVTQPFTFGGGAYLADGWHDQADFFAPSPGLQPISAAINDSGVIVGSTMGSDSIGWIYQPGLGSSLVDVSHLGLFGNPRLITNEGHIIGTVTVEGPPGSYYTHLYVKKSGQSAVDIHHPSFGAESSGLAATWPYVAAKCLDASRVPIGTSRVNAVTGASDFIPDDPFELLGGFNAVNARGEIVGNAVTDIYPRSPWIARSGAERTYLRDLINDPFEQTWMLTTAHDINDRGQIVLSATRVSDGASRVIILTPRCIADFNGSGSASIDDLFLFLNAWFSGDPAADVNNAGGVSIDDLFLYLNAYFTGCP